MVIDGVSVGYYNNTSPDPSDDDYFPLMDRMGNVTGYKKAQTTIPAGQLDAVYDYDAFGQEVRSTGPAADVVPYHFSTKFTDATGLVYYGYRWYDAQKGRWLSRDPIGEAGGVNIYMTARNNVTRLIDRLGLDVKYVDVKVMNWELFGDDKEEYHAQLMVSTHCDSKGNVVLDKIESRTLANGGDTDNNPNATVATIECGEGHSGILVSWSGSAEEEDANVAEWSGGIGGGVGVVAGGIIGGMAGALEGGAPAIPGAIGGASAGGTIGGGLGLGVGGLLELIGDDEWKISWKVQFKICCGCFEKEWSSRAQDAKPVINFSTNNDDFYADSEP
jgi:RHS repeat-associated protein